MGANASRCTPQGENDPSADGGGGTPPSDPCPPPPPPPIKVNTAVTESQTSGSTFDTSLQRTQQMGISPLHL